jgi:hypothetical protein
MVVVVCPPFFIADAPLVVEDGVAFRRRRRKDY